MGVFDLLASIHEDDGERRRWCGQSVRTKVH